MLVEVEEIQHGELSVRPATGRLAGRILATAECLALSDVTRKGRRLYGTLTASWGVTVLRQDIDDATRIELVGRRAFDYHGCKPVDMESLGKARRLILNGHELLGVVDAL